MSTTIARPHMHRTEEQGLSPLQYTSHPPAILRRLLPLLLVIFLDTLSYFLIIPVLLQLFTSHSSLILAAHTSDATRDLLYGVAIALSPLAFLLACPLMGYLSDRYGRKNTLVFCLLSAVVGFTLPIVGILKNSVLLILLGRFIAGVSTSSQPVAQAAIADFTRGKQRAFYLSMIAFAMTLAMILGPLVGALLSNSSLVSWFNIAMPYWLGTVLALLNIIFLWVFFNDDDKQPIKKNSPPLRQLLQTLVKHNVRGLILLFFLVELAWSDYYQSIFLFLQQQFHYTPDKIGLFTAYAGFWMLLGLTVVYRIVIRYISITRFLQYSLWITTLSLIGCNLSDSVIAQWIFVIPTAMFVGTSYVSLLALISNRTSAEHQGWVLGIASTALGLAWMLTGFSANWAIHWFNWLPLLFAALTMATAVLLLPRWIQPKAS